MGASASLMESLTPEQQEAMKAKYDALIAEGKTEEEAVAALQAEGVPPAAEAPAAEAPAAEAPAAEAPAEGEAAAAPAEGEAGKFSNFNQFFHTISLWSLLSGV